jgi:cell division initiation protein
MLLPNELLSKKFDKYKAAGYKATEVDSFMVEVASLFSQNSRELTELKRRLETTTSKLSALEGDRENINNALLSAQRLADSIIKEATGRADIVSRDADIKAEKIIDHARGEIVAQRDELARIKREVTSFRSKLINIYRGHLESINAIPVEREDEPVSSNLQEQPLAPTVPNPKTEPDSQAETATQVSDEQTVTAAAQPEALITAVPMIDADAVTKSQMAATLQLEQPEVEKPLDETLEEQQTEIKRNVKFNDESGEYIPFSSSSASKSNNGLKFGANYDIRTDSFDSGHNSRKK